MSMSPPYEASFHELKLTHGNMSRHSSLIMEKVRVKLLDFERFEPGTEKYGPVDAELVGESGRGGYFIFHDNGDIPR